MNEKRAKELRRQARERCKEAKIPLRTSYVRVESLLGQRTHQKVLVTELTIGPKGGMVRSPKLDAEGNKLVYNIPSVTLRLGQCQRGVYQRVKRALR